MPFRNFAKYKEDIEIFIETGTYLGDGIQSALDAGFKTVGSIEVDKVLADMARNRFMSNDRVWIYATDSSEYLWDVIKRTDARIMFWLDGHYSGTGTGHGPMYYPLIEELKQIERHPRKDHTIIIDDMRLVETEWCLDIKDVLHWIYKINPKYKITYEDGYVANDVLVAKCLD